MTKTPFDLEALNQEIATERERIKDKRIKNIKYTPEDYKVLCKLLTRLRYNTNEDAKELTKLRSKTFNKKKLALSRSNAIPA